MHADTATLIDVLYSQNQYVIPIFQRYYSWRKSDWENIWDEITDLRDPEQGTSAHFMGSIVLDSQKQKSLSKPAFQVIDGQQRLMTFTLVMCALRNAAKRQGFEKLCEAIEETTLLDPHEEGNHRFRVYPRHRDRDSFMAAVEGNGKTDGRIAEALSFFSERVEQLEEAKTEKDLRNFFDLIKWRIEFVHIILDGENVYEIFRSLNSTGQPLSEADLIRNFVFMHVSLDEQDRFDDKLWKPIERHFEDSEGQLDGGALSTFFRAFLMRTGRYTKPTATFQEFERRYSGAMFDPEDLAIQLGWHAGYYDVIRGREKHRSERVEAALAKLRGLDASTTRSLLLNLLHRREEGELSDEDLAQCIEMVSGFILRRYVCNVGSRAYSRWFVSACRDLGNQPVEGLQSFLVAGREYPDDVRFEQCLLRFKLYQSDYGRHVLERLERSYPHKESADISQAEIEHIMPQTLDEEWKHDLGHEHERIHAEWLHTLGNLTLSAYHKSVSNRAFRVKRDEYERSKITLTHQLATKTAWGEDEILARGTELAGRATTIWIGP